MDKILLQYIFPLFLLYKSDLYIIETKSVNLRLNLNGAPKLLIVISAYCSMTLNIILYRFIFRGEVMDIS